MAEHTNMSDKIIELYINNQLVQGLDDVDIQVTYSVKEVQSPEENTGVYSIDFDIPGNSYNNTLFKNIFEINAQVNFNPNGKNTSELRVNGTSIGVGSLQLNHIGKKYVNENEIDIYNVTFFGLTKSLFIDLKDKYFKDLDLSAYDHVPTNTNISVGWGYDVNRGWNYKLIDYNMGIEWGVLQSQNSFRPWLLYPGTYNKTIIDGIFKQYGYKYKSNFFSTDQRFLKTFVPYSQSRIYPTAALVSARNTAGTLHLSTTIGKLYANHIDFQNYGTSYIVQSSNYSSYATVQDEATYTCVNRIKGIDPTNNTWVVNYIGIYPGQAGVIKSSVYVNGLNLGIDKYIQASVTLQPTEALMVQISNYSPSGVIYNDTSYQLFYGTDTGFTQNVELEKCLPSNILITDYLVSLNKMFNLHWEYDKFDPTIIYIEPFEDYYSFTGKTYYDWNSKIDNDNELELSFLSDLQKPVVSLKYDTGNDYYNDDYNKKNPLEYGEYRLNYTGNSFVDTSSVFEINCTPAQPSVTNRAAISGPYNYPFVCPKYWTDNMTSANFANRNPDVGLRFLYDGDIELIGGGYKWWFGNTYLDTYPQCGHELFPYHPTVVNNYDLNFYSNSLYYEPSITSNNLYELYWKSYWNSINNVNARMLKGKFHLEETDINPLRMNDVIILKEAFWHINKLTYNAGEHIHEVELIKIVDDVIFVKHHPIEVTLAYVTKDKNNSILGWNGASTIGNNVSNGLIQGNNNIINPANQITNIIVSGNDNKVYDGSSNTTIFGNNNSVSGSGITIIGDNITATNSNSTYVSGSLYIDQSGQIGHGNKKNILSTDIVGVEENFQYLIYNDLNVAGTLTTDGEVLIENGSLDLSGSLNIGLTGELKMIDEIGFNLSGGSSIDFVSWGVFDSHTGNTNNPHYTSFYNLTATAHTHNIGDIVNLQSNLNNKVEYGVFNSHTGDTTVHHTISELSSIYLPLSGGTITGSLIIDGSLSTGFSGITNNLTLNSNHNIISASGNIIITLPTAIGITGRQYTIKKIDTGTTLTINTTGGQTIDGSSSLTITFQYTSCSVVSNGLNWLII